jgi:hypothetical protein
MHLNYRQISNQSDSPHYFHIYLHQPTPPPDKEEWLSWEVLTPTALEQSNPLFQPSTTVIGQISSNNPMYLKKILCLYHTNIYVNHLSHSADIVIIVIVDDNDDDNKNNNGLLDGAAVKNKKIVHQFMGSVKKRNRKHQT